MKANKKAAIHASIEADDREAVAAAIAHLTSIDKYGQRRFDKDHLELPFEEWGEENIDSINTPENIVEAIQEVRAFIDRKQRLLRKYHVDQGTINWMLRQWYDQLKEYEEIYFS